MKCYQLGHPFLLDSNQNVYVINFPALSCLTLILNASGFSLTSNTIVYTRFVSSVKTADSTKSVCKSEN